MKKVLFVAIVLAGGWWYFVGGRTLTDERVRTFYADFERVQLDREPEAICAMLADDFESVGSVSIGGGSRNAAMNRTQTCDGYVQLYQSFEKLGDTMGGILQLDSKYEIHSIELSPDKKTATVDISTSMDVAGSVMNMHGRSTDTLIRRNGKVLLLRSDGKGSVSSGG